MFKTLLQNQKSVKTDAWKANLIFIENKQEYGIHEHGGTENVVFITELCPAPPWFLESIRSLTLHKGLGYGF